MSGPSRKPSRPSSHHSSEVLAYLQQVRQRADAFRRTVENEIEATRALIDELRVRQAKRRGHKGGPG